MTERKELFTPGPWTMHEWFSSVTIRDGKTMVCRCTANATGKKYAKFLKTAPEMHDWQSDALAEMRRICPMLGVPCDLRERLEHLIERGEEIQKKARGEA